MDSRIREFDRGWDRWWCSSFWWGMEREREKYENGRNGWNNNFFFFFFTRERDFWLDIFVVKGVEGWRIDEYYSVIVTARYGLLYVPGEIYSPWKNMYMLDGILG